MDCRSSRQHRSSLERLTPQVGHSHGKVVALPAVLSIVNIDSTGTDQREIVVFWRPSCGYCSSLRRQLDGAHVRYRPVNIWEDPEAAGVVRSITGGNETVPTVLVGSVGLVNPGLHQLLAVALEHAPESVPEGYEPPEPGRVGRWINRTLGG